MDNKENNHKVADFFNNYFNIKKIIDDKKEWKLYQKRISELPKDFKKAMEGVQTYMFHFAGGPATIDVLYSVLEMFEDSVAEGKEVSDVIGSDIGTFCEDMIKAVPEASWLDGYKKKMQNKINKKINKKG